LEGILRTIDDFARAALDFVVLPLLIDTLMCLANVAHGADADVLAAVLAMKNSILWRDAFNCGACCYETLSEFDWYLGLRDKQLVWNLAHQELQAALASAPQPCAPRGATEANVEAKEQRCNAAKDVLIESAALRLAQDRPLLQPLQGTHTLLSDAHWETMQRTVASQVLFILLAVFEENRDFHGAMYDLVVAIAQSPWILSLARPAHVRTFLCRLSLIPTLMAPLPSPGSEGAVVPAPALTA